MASDQETLTPVVLIVEDEPILRLLAVGIAEDAGFDAVTAANADDAIALLAKRSDIKIVFTDIAMPGTMDGLKFAAIVRDRWPPIEIIVTSGRATPTEADLPSRGRFFAKPYDATRVMDEMRRMAA